MATAQVRDALRELAPGIDADLGGTNMGSALENAMVQFGPADAQRSRAIILVTDGAVQAHDIDGARIDAHDLGVRVFVVAVGGCAAVEVLAPLAESTGAVLERAVPAEPIDELVLCQFRRARCNGPVQVEAHWADAQATPIAMGIAYPGDALAVAASLPDGITGDVCIRAAALNFTLTIPLPAPSSAPALRALLGQQMYRQADASTRASIALRYGLLTADTSAVLVKQRAEGERIEVMPTIVPIPEMLPDDMMCCDAMECEDSGSASWRSVLGIDDFSADVSDPPLLYRKGAAQIPEWDKPQSTGEIAEPSIAISATIARQLLSEIHRLLRKILLGPTAADTTLSAVLEQLTDEQRPTARALLRAVGIELDDPRMVVPTLWVLNALLDGPEFTDNEEARLAVAGNRGCEGQTTSDVGNAIDIDGLQARVALLLRDGLPGSTDIAPAAS